MRTSMKITIKDIARKAGVSHPTVSRALNDNPLISEKLRRRIKKLAAEMGYIPNIYARGLNTTRSYAIGIIMNYLNNPFSSEIFEGAEEVASKNNYMFFFGDSREDPEREYRYIRAFAERGVDGLLIYPNKRNMHKKSITFLEKVNIPHVFLNHYPTQYHCSYVVCDEEKGGRIQAEYLINAGHQSIAYILQRGISETTGRSKAFKNHLNHCGIELPDKNIYRIDGYEMALEGYEATMALLQKKLGISALALFSDELLPGVFKAIDELILHVPRDISIIGYGNIKACFPENLNITTVNYPRFETGASAMNILLSQINNPGSNATKDKCFEILSPEIVLGDSC
jgi:DNA-binding LacI/PurR family transcriptional regulator